MQNINCEALLNFVRDMASIGRYFEKALGLKQYPPVVSISFIILAEKQAAKSAKSMESNF